MSHIPLEIPDDLVSGNSGLRQEDVAGLAREALLVRLYALGHISSGRAAELLSVSRRQFLDLAGEYGVAVFADPDDLTAESHHSTLASQPLPPRRPTRLGHSGL
jgi:predicted HTH domain antitoxin